MKSHRAPYAAVAAVLLIWAAYMALLGPVDWDLAWQFFLAKKVLLGQHLYVDVGITEQHPPLYTWLCVAATAVARLLSLEPMRFFIGIAGLTAIACAYYATRIADADPLIFAAAGVAALAFNGFASGSGEVLAVAMVLPYLACVATKRESVGVGLLSGLGMAIKPHYALVWLIAETIVAIQRRSVRSLFRPMSIAIVAVWLTYILLTWFLTPEYFQAAATATRYYGAFLPQKLIVLLLSGASLYFLSASLLVALFWRKSPMPTLPLIFISAAAAFWIGAIVQGKGWPHHWTPALGMSTLALVSLWPTRHRMLATAVVLVFGSYKLWSTAQHMKHLQDGWPTFLPGLTHVVEMFAARGPVFLASIGLAPSFPMINNTGAEWTLSESSLWMIPGLFPTEWPHEGPYHLKQPQHWTPFEREVHEIIWNSVEKRPPEIVIIERGRARFDFHAFLAQDPRMRAFLSHFTKVGMVGPFDVLLPTARTSR